MLWLFYSYCLLICARKLVFKNRNLVFIWCFAQNCILILRWPDRISIKSFNFLLVHFIISRQPILKEKKLGKESMYSKKRKYCLLLLKLWIKIDEINENNPEKTTFEKLSRSMYLYYSPINDNSNNKKKKICLLKKFRDKKWKYIYWLKIFYSSRNRLIDTYSIRKKQGLNPLGVASNY